MRIAAMVFGLSIGVASTASASPRADIVVYGDHLPTYNRNGVLQDFHYPFIERDVPTDPATHVLVEAVSGVSTPLGSTTWSIEGFGKYVLLGNYDEGHSGAFQHIDDQLVGVLDTEKKTFCHLDMNPAALVDSSVEWMATTNPDARQSRILVQGFGGAPLGYIDADLDNPNPCDPDTGWHVRTFSAAEINAAASTLPADRKPCGYPCGIAACSFDGMALLRHDASGVDTFVAHEYFGKRVIVGNIDAAGDLSITDVYPMPVWQPDAGNGACFSIQPVASPTVDRTRPATDQRFASGFDMVCDVPDGTSGCSPWIPFCPGSGTTCTIGSTCPTKVCSNSFAACDSDADCTAICAPAGTCTDACQLIHPGAFCSVTSSQHCFRNDDCPSGEYCSCGPGRPFQEFSFDGSTITPTSAQVQTAAGYGSGVLSSSYDTAGDLWVGEGAPNFSTPNHWAVYGKNAMTGEHSYYTTSNPAGSEIWAPDASFSFETTHGSFGLVGAVQPLVNATYGVGFASIQRAFTGFGTWTVDPDYKVSFGKSTLPAESKRCFAGVNGGDACVTNADCPGSACLLDEGAVGGLWSTDLTIGGSPPSLWTTPMFGDNQLKHGHISAWMVRVPVPVGVPDGISAVRPGIAWTSSASCANGACDRLWMVAEHGGVLKFRIRDDGLWSTWQALPTNIASAGGASPIFVGGNLEIYARSSAGTVMMTSLTSALSCAAASCTWASWQVLPGSPTTDKEPAVEVQSTVGPFVAIRRASDGRVLYARRQSGTWSTWRLTSSSVLTSFAPALVWNPDDTNNGRMWVIVRDQSDVLQYGRIDSLSFGSWATIPRAAPEPWGTAPAAIWDGDLVRVLVGVAAYPNWVQQLTAYSDGSGTHWDTWAPVFSRGQATSQPSATLIGNDVDMMTYWYTAGAFDQLVK